MSARISVAALRAAFTYDPVTGLLYRKAGVLAGRPSGSLRPDGRLNVYFCGQRVLAHRVAWAIHYGEWPSIQIDHANGIKDDNRLANLRLATNSQNQANVGLKSNNTSGCKGVSRNRHGKWRVDLCVGGVKQRLGTYADKHVAAAVYRRAALAAFGSFAHIPEVK